MCSQKYDQMYSILLDSRGGGPWAEQLLPELLDLLKEARREDAFWAARQRRLSERQMMMAWAQYRRDLRELRDRLKAKKDLDDDLEWLVHFVLQHIDELTHVSTFYDPSFTHSLQMQGGDLLTIWRTDWQKWCVQWLRDSLRDTDLDADLPPAAPVSGGGQGGGDDMGDATNDMTPKPKKPDPDDDPSPGF